MKSVYQLFPKEFVTGLLFWLFILLLVADISEAQFFNSKLAGTSPRTRMGSYPFSTLGTDFLDFEELGHHAYRFGLSEKNGILYTCKGGHIDTAHLRKAADWTAFIAAKTFGKLMENETEFSFRLMEPSRYHVKITYPENWDDLSEEQKEDIAFDISIRLGEYFIYTATTWHEIITWFGYKCTGFLYSEFASAFTWEDTFSNLLGTYIAAEALRDTEHEYDEAMTLALERELEKLGVQPSRTAKGAAKKVKGQWFSNNLLFFINMKKRHFDIGLDDGFVTPSIVPSVAGCEGAEALSYPVPSLGFLSEYGFSVKFEIEPREMERGKILRIVYSDNTEGKERIEPAVHFAAIMDRIKEEAVKKYGRDVDLCEEPQRLLAKATNVKERIGSAVGFAVTENIIEVAEQPEESAELPVEATGVEERIEPAVDIFAVTENIIEVAEQPEETTELLAKATGVEERIESSVDIAVAENIIEVAEQPEESAEPLVEATDVEEQIEPAFDVAAVADSSEEEATVESVSAVDISEESAESLIEAADVEEQIEPAFDIFAVTKNIIEVAEQPEESAEPLVEAAETKEQVEPAVHFAAIMDNIKEDAVRRYGRNVDLRDARPRQLAKAAGSPMKTYDFGFKVSESYFSDTSSETIVAVDIDSSCKFDIKELAFMASQWLEEVNE